MIDKIDKIMPVIKTLLHSLTANNPVNSTAAPTTFKSSVP